MGSLIFCALKNFYERDFCCSLFTVQEGGAGFSLSLVRGEKYKIEKKLERE
jgi:hypothetical protein